MKQNYSWFGMYYKKFLTTFTLVFLVSALFAQTLTNGNLGTGATSLNGTAAAAGTTWHELQNVTGNTTESNSTLGVSHASIGATNNTLADNFIVPSGNTWTLNNFTMYSIDQVVPPTGTTSPYTNIRIRIWNGVPGAVGSTIVFGDLTTNRFLSTAFSGRKAIFNSQVPTPGAPAPNLPIFSITGTLGTSVVLTAGNYWIEWQIAHTANCFSPTSQTVGVRTLPCFNARQSVAAVWSDLIDGGSPASAPDVAIDLPFILTYTATTVAACTGTPAPGNTISSSAGVCPNTPFTLSLQNSVPGTGVTYQWQQSTTGVGGPYVNITCATNPTLFVPNMTTTTFYQAIVTCGGNSATSTPVGVNAIACYCVSGASDIDDEDIFNVTFGTLNNSSTCLTLAPGAGSILRRYSNYTGYAGAPVATVLRGISTPLSVQIGTCGGNFTNSVAIWIDYNQDGTFAATERVYNSPGGILGPHIETTNITIPVTALPGTTRMRVINNETGNSNSIPPCGSVGYIWGETEDYNVNIVIPTPCTGTPAPGNTVSTQSSVCSGTTGFTLSLQNNPAVSGLTYQWFSSPTVGGTYAPITGAMGSTLTVASITAATCYYAAVTCSGVTTNSTPVCVTLNPPNQCYCASAASDIADEEVLNVTVGSLNNSSTCTTLAPGPGSILRRYSNYTNYPTAPTAPNVEQGTNVPVSIQIGTCGGNFTNSTAIFIDLNADGDFVDAGERVYTSASSFPGPHVETGNLVIPVTATLGVTRMRVVNSEVGNPLTIPPCSNAGYIWGETEDYNVNIIPCVPISVTSQPTSTSAICGSSSSFTIATTGSAPIYQWQYRISGTSPWINVTNVPPYSGSNTATLSINPVATGINGYQYRVLYSGGCSAVDFSSVATLTVTPVIATVTPVTASICAGAVQAISLTSTLSSTLSINEGFNTGIPTGWAVQNRSVPIGTIPNWAQGTVADAGYPAFSGAPNSFVYSDYQVAAQTGVPNTISNWLFTPSIGVKNGDILTFRTRQPGGTDYPDRLEVRLSSNGTSTNVGATATSVGDFTTLLLTINPTLVTGVYPKVWTQFTVTISGLAAPVTGRLAFRVFTPDNGTGTNQNQVGLDDVAFTSNGALAQGVYTIVSPTGGANTIFVDPAATIPYTGTPATTVYVKPTVTSTYGVTYTTASGCVSTQALSTITVNNAVTGTATLTSTTVCEGSNTTFTLGGTLSGAATYNHQYQVSTNGGATFTNISNGGVYSGANTSALTLTNIPASFNGYRFRDSISAVGNCGSLLSTVAVLTVNPKPIVTISAAPIRNLFPGLTTTLTAAVSPNATGATYQWFRNGTAVVGATSNRLVVGIDALGTYTIRVIDGNLCVAAAGTSTPASIVIGDSSNLTRLFIYPSPNRGQFQIRYFNDVTNNGLVPGVVNIYDEKGSRVFSKFYAVGGGYQPMNVDLGPNLGKGIYRVDLLTNSGERIKTGSVIIF